MLGSHDASPLADGKAKTPGTSSVSQPRRTSRFSFDRTLSILESFWLPSPIPTAICVARSGVPASAWTSRS